MAMMRETRREGARVKKCPISELLLLVSDQIAVIRFRTMTFFVQTSKLLARFSHNLCTGRFTLQFPLHRSKSNLLRPNLLRPQCIIDNDLLLVHHELYAEARRWDRADLKDRVCYRDRPDRYPTAIQLSIYTDHDSAKLRLRLSPWE
jgi:hypothetical protein